MIYLIKSRCDVTAEGYPLFDINKDMEIVHQMDNIFSCELLTMDDVDWPDAISRNGYYYSDRYVNDPLDLFYNDYTHTELIIDINFKCGEGDGVYRMLREKVIVYIREFKLDLIIDIE